MHKTANIKEFKKVIVLFNRNSGKQIFASMLARVNELFKQLKLAVGSKRVQLVDIVSFSQLDAHIDHIVQEQADWVIIAGGDGTIRTVVEKLWDRGYHPYISVFPAGTVNLIAKELQLSSEPLKWMKRISKGIQVPVYLGRANGRLFLTVAGVGFDSLVVDQVTELEKRLLNKMAYIYQSTEIMRKELLFKDWRYSFEVAFDEEEQWHRASSIIVGKSRYYAGRYSLFNGAALSSPVLHAAVFTGHERSDFVRYAAYIAMEALHMDDTIMLRSAKKITIRCNTADFPVELDGDAITVAPVQLSLDERPAVFLA